MKHQRGPMSFLQMMHHVDVEVAQPYLTRDELLETVRGLTMYDAQKIKQMAAAEGALDNATIHKVGIMGALSLYLDFVNLFLYILRFLGKKR